MGYALVWVWVCPGMGKFAEFWEIYAVGCGKYEARVSEPLWWGRSLWWLEAADELEVKEAGGEAVWNGVGGVGEIFDQHVGDGIGPIDEVEYFEGGPDIFEITEGAMAAAVAFFAVEQQGAEAYVDADIGIDCEGIAIAQVAGNIERKVTAVEKVEEGF